MGNELNRVDTIYLNTFRFLIGKVNAGYPLHTGIPWTKQQIDELGTLDECKMRVRAYNATIELVKMYALDILKHSSDEEAIKFLRDRIDTNLIDEREADDILQYILKGSKRYF